MITRDLNSQPGIYPTIQFLKEEGPNQQCPMDTTDCLGVNDGVYKLKACLALKHLEDRTSRLTLNDLTPDRVVDAPEATLGNSPAFSASVFLFGSGCCDAIQPSVVSVCSLWQGPAQGDTHPTRCMAALCQPMAQSMAEGASKIEISCYVAIPSTPVDRERSVVGASKAEVSASLNRRSQPCEQIDNSEKWVRMRSYRSLRIVHVQIAQAADQDLEQVVGGQERSSRKGGSERNRVEPGRSCPPLYSVCMYVQLFAGGVGLVGVALELCTRLAA